MKKESRYLVTEQRWLLYLFASKSPVWALSYALPITGLWVYFWTMTDMRPLQSLYGVGFGVAFWMLFEYFVHRFIYHVRPTTNSLSARFLRSFHLYHHEVPEDKGVLTNGWIPAISCNLFFGLIFFIALPNFEMFGAAMVSLNVYHHYYEWVHHLVHKKTYSTGRLAFLQRYHLRHHLNWNVNYGQTTSLMDRLFGTYEPVTHDSRLSVKHIFENLPKTISFAGKEVTK